MFNSFVSNHYLKRASRCALLLIIPFCLTACEEQVCGDSFGLQECLMDAAEKGASAILLEEKDYFVTETIELRDNLTVIGKGAQTVISWHPSVASEINKPLMYTSSADNVTLSNFKLSGSIDQHPNSMDLRHDHIGLYYDCEGDPKNVSSLECQNLKMQNIEVEYFTHGIHIKGARNVQAIDLDLHDNGNTEADLFHNIYYRRVVDVYMKQTDPNKGGFYNSPRGHGIRASYLYNATFEGLQVYGNADHGVNFSDIGNTVFNSVHIRDNCTAPTGICSQYACYGGACDVKFIPESVAILSGIQYQQYSEAALNISWNITGLTEGVSQIELFRNTVNGNSGRIMISGVPDITGTYEDVSIEPGTDYWYMFKIRLLSGEVVNTSPVGPIKTLGAPGGDI